MRSHEEEQQQDYRHHYHDDRDNHMAIGDSPPPSTFSASPESSRSYKTPSPAADFGNYSDHFSWSGEPEPMAQPNRSYPAEPLVVTKSLDPESHKNVDHSVESHDGDEDDEEGGGEEERTESDVDSEREKNRAVDGNERTGGNGDADGGRGSFNRRKMRPELKTKRTTTTTTTGTAARYSSHGVAKRALLGFRVCGFAFCLISFSVMAANRYQGWALDSFFRYKEFKYCLGVNVLGFVYSGFQVFDLIHYVTTQKHLVRHHFRYFTDFFFDQAISYLLMSASSSAMTRVDDWQANWGKDKFPDMARTSVGFSFAAFGSLALSSVISGYILCTSRSL